MSKVEYAIEMKFLSGKWTWGRGGNNTSKFTQVYCWTPSRRFSRQHVGDEPSMCSSI